MTDDLHTDLSAGQPRVLLQVRGIRSLAAARREQEALLEGSCLFAHIWRPLRDYQTGHLYLVCRVCRQERDWNDERYHHDDGGAE